MRTVTVAHCAQENGSVPMIRLRGKWLALLGFKQGQRVTIEVAAGKLVLILMP